MTEPVPPPSLPTYPPTPTPPLGCQVFKQQQEEQRTMIREMQIKQEEEARRQREHESRMASNCKVS